MPTQPSTAELSDVVALALQVADRGLGRAKLRLHLLDRLLERLGVVLRRGLPNLVDDRCKTVQDIEGDFIDLKQLSKHVLDGFDLTQPVVEVFGLCRRCSAKK